MNDQREKITIDDRERIYQLRLTGKMTYRKLASMFGISIPRASAICYEIEDRIQRETEKEHKENQ